MSTLQGGFASGADHGSLEITCLGYGEDLRMVFARTEHRPKLEAPTAIGGSGSQRREELGSVDVEGAGGRHQVPAGREKPHGPQIDLMVAPQSLRHGRTGLGEGRWVQHYRIEPLAIPLEGAKRLKCICLPPDNVGEAIQLRVGRT